MAALDIYPGEALVSDQFQFLAVVKDYVNELFVPVDVLDHGVSARAGSIAYVFPSGAVIVARPPEVVFDLQCWRGGIGPDLIACGIQQPVSVQRPVPYAVIGLFNADDGRFGILAVIHSYGVRGAECEGVADDAAVLHYRDYVLHPVSGLKHVHDGLERGDVGVHLVAQCLQTRNPLLVVVQPVPDLLMA